MTPFMRDRLPVTRAALDLIDRLGEWEALDAALYHAELRRAVAGVIQWRRARACGFLQAAREGRGK